MCKHLRPCIPVYMCATTYLHVLSCLQVCTYMIVYVLTYVRALHISITHMCVKERTYIHNSTSASEAYVYTYIHIYIYIYITVHTYVCTYAYRRNYLHIHCFINAEILNYDVVPRNKVTPRLQCTSQFLARGVVEGPDPRTVPSNEGGAGVAFCSLPPIPSCFRRRRSNSH